MLSIVVKFPIDKAGVKFQGPSTVQLPAAKTERAELKPYTPIQAILQGDHEVKVQGFGMPFSNPGHPAEAILNHNKPIAHGVTLVQLLQQRTFNFLVQVPQGGTTIEDYLTLYWPPILSRTEGTWHVKAKDRAISTQPSAILLIK